jgi:pimeloyl-ACP methyl ester carboxylesterase
MWVSRHPLNNSLAVFIHGIWGSRWATWRSHVDFFQGIYERAPVLRSYDIYFFHYQTGRTRQPPLYPDVTEELRAFLKTEGERYNTIVLVCHSQGGLLGKRYILDELMQGRGEAMKVDVIVTLNTPHRGARLYVHPLLYVAKLLNIISRLRHGLFLRQLAELTSLSRNVRFVTRNWGTTYISRLRGEATAHRRCIRSVTLASSHDLLVSKRSAEGFEIDSPDYGSETHAADSKVMAEYVGKCLSEHEDPLALHKELNGIYVDSGRLANHRHECEAIAIKLIEQKWGAAVPRGYVSSKALCLCEDFREAFDRHPLRKLGLMKAFETYVQKVLSD